MDPKSLDNLTSETPYNNKDTEKMQINTKLINIGNCRFYFFKFDKRIIKYYFNHSKQNWKILKFIC